MLNTLKKLLEQEKKNKSIFDIIIYGSSVKGTDKPGDVDIMVIFLEGSLRERLDYVQQIKSKIASYSVDLKQMLLTDFFSSSFFARTGIVLEGYSIFNSKKFSEILGFKAYTLFWYSLQGLSHAQKVKFNYILAGRNAKGIIKSMNGIRLANGAIKIPIEQSTAFEQILINNKVKYSRKNILEEI